MENWPNTARTAGDEGSRDESTAYAPAHEVDVDGDYISTFLELTGLYIEHANALGFNVTVGVAGDSSHPRVELRVERLETV
jgi:hypothetical protein